MRKIIFLLSFLAVLGVAQGATQVYIPSTSTYQGNSSVINIASATIRYLNISTVSAVNIPNTAINVKNPPYNAKGDGTTDDILAIKAAIAAASPLTSTNTCGTVYFPIGTYNVSDQVPLPSCVTIEGENEFSSIISASAAFPRFSAIVRILTSTGVLYGLTTNTFANKSTIRNITIDGSKSPVFMDIYGLMLNQVNYGTAENVYVKNVPGYGIYVAGASTSQMQYYTTIKDVILENNGTSSNHNDQLGGAYLYGSHYDHITCTNSNGTCVDNDASVSGVWENILSTNSNIVGSGQVWSDFGMENSVIQNCRLFGGSIHLFGDGTVAGVPNNDLIMGNYVEGGGTGILIGSADTASFSSGNRIIGNTVNLSSGNAIAVQYASGTVITGNNIKTWATGTGQTSAAIDVLGRYATVTSNTGLFGPNSSVWLNEAYTLSGLGEGNVVANNNFPGSTISFGTASPLSSVVDYQSSTNSVRGNWLFNNNASFQGASFNGNVIVSSDIYNVPLTDYSGTSTIVGISTFSAKVIQYKKVGKTVTAYFYMVGNGSNIATTFTLPYVMNGNTADLLNIYYAIDNSGTPAAGTWIMFANNATVTLYPTPAGGNWTASGTRTISGTIVYETN